jgi:hypothetical protein
MTPKEKAKELVDKFRLNILDYEGSGLNTFKAKQCAIITVDEILNSRPLWPNDADWDDCGATHKYWYEAQKEEALKFWEEVKQEIFNL